MMKKAIMVFVATSSVTNAVLHIITWKIGIMRIVPAARIRGEDDDPLNNNAVFKIK